MMDLNQITIPSSDLYRAVRFYECLGLRLIVDSRPKYVRMIVPERNTTFSIHHVENIDTKKDTPVLYFESDHLDQLVNRLKMAGFNFDLDPVDQRWMWREAHIRDVDGNRLILYLAGVNRKDPPWRISDRDFIIQPFLKQWIFLPQESHYIRGKMPTTATYRLEAEPDRIHAYLNWTIDGLESHAESEMVIDGEKHKVDEIHTSRCYIEDSGIVSEQYMYDRMIARTQRRVVLGGLLSVESEHFSPKGDSYTNLQIYRPLI